MKINTDQASDGLMGGLFPKSSDKPTVDLKCKANFLKAPNLAVLSSHWDVDLGCGQPEHQHDLGKNSEICFQKLRPFKSYHFAKQIPVLIYSCGVSAGFADIHRDSQPWQPTSAKLYSIMKSLSSESCSIAASIAPSSPMFGPTGIKGEPWCHTVTEVTAVSIQYFYLKIGYPKSTGLSWFSWLKWPFGIYATFRHTYIWHPRDVLLIFYSSYGLYIRSKQL